MLNQQKKQSGSILFSLGNTGCTDIPLIKTDQQNQKLQKNYKERAWDEYLLLERPMAWENKKFPHLRSCSSYSKCFFPNISWSTKKKKTARESALLLLQCNLRKSISTSFKFISTLVTENKVWTANNDTYKWCFSTLTAPKWFLFLGSTAARHERASSWTPGSEKWGETWPFPNPPSH